MCFLFWLDKLYNNFLEMLKNFNIKNISFNPHKNSCELTYVSMYHIYKG